MRKIIISGGLGFILLVMAATFWVAPALVDSSALKQQIQAELRRQHMGVIDYESMGLRLLPTLHLAFEKVDYAGPDSVSASVEKLTVYPEVWPLFSGRLRLKKIVMYSPAIVIHISDEAGTEAESENASDPFNPLTLPAKLVDSLGDHTSFLKMVVHRGYFQLTTDGQRRFELKDLHFKAGLNIQTNRSFGVQADVNHAMLIVTRESRKTSFDCEGLSARLVVDEKEARLSLEELLLEQPAGTFSGRMVASPDTFGYILDFSASDLDAGAVRKAALDLGGGHELVRDIFAYIKGGRIPALRITTRGKTPIELGDWDNLVIQGRMEKGDIAIQDIGMSLTGVNGDVMVSKGLLAASGVSAIFGKTIGTDGSLKIGLAEDDYTFHLDVMLDVRLRQLPGVLENIIDHEAFMAELARVENLEGNVRGRLVLGEHLEDIHTRVDVFEMDFSADYDRLPFPVHVNRGKLLFSENQVRVENVDAGIGNTDFSGVSGAVKWENRLYVDIPRGRMDLDLAEFYPWVSAFKGVQEDFSDVEQVTGRLQLSAFSLEKTEETPDAPEDLPDRWRLSTAGEVKNAEIMMTTLPDRLYLDSGAIEVDAGRVLFRHLKTRLLDASADLSGMAEGDIRHPCCADLVMNGEVGKNFIGFLIDTGRLSRDYAVQTPVRFSDTDIRWQSGPDVSFAGHLIFPEETRILTDFSCYPGALQINRLEIADKDSSASCTLGLEKDKISLAFNGIFDSQTLDRVFVAEKMPGARIRGDVTAVFVKGDLSESFVNGRLEGKNIRIPGVGGDLPMADEFIVYGRDKRVDVDRLAVSWRDNYALLSGRVNMTPDHMQLRLDASAGDLKWPVSGKTPQKSDTQPVVDSDGDLWGYPLIGSINLDADSFSLGPYTWQPVQAVITLDRKILETTVTKATLCGIDTLGTIHLDDGTVNLNVDFSAENQDFTSSYGCLSANEIEMSGSYDLSGQFTASAPSFEQLFASAGGQFEFIARDGVITRSKRLSRILEVINFTEIVKGRLPDLKSKGFSYDTIIIEGSLENHLMSFNQIMMDGKTLDLLGKGTLRLDRDRLDVELVAAPFQTVDSAIKNIPGVNYLMAGTLVSIPVRIKGKSADPKVSVMSAADISSNFLDFVERAVKSPVKLIQNWNPYNKSTAPE